MMFPGYFFSFGCEIQEDINFSIHFSKNYIIAAESYLENGRQNLRVRKYK